MAFSARSAQSVTAMLMPLSSLIQRREKLGILTLVHRDVGTALNVNRVDYQSAKPCKDYISLIHSVGQPCFLSSPLDPLVVMNYPLSPGIHLPTG